MRYLSLFSGAGGGDLGLQHLLGWECCGYVEWNDYCCRIIENRIRDGFLSPAPVFHMDIRDFNRQVAGIYCGMVDAIAGGFPCQDISCAGKKAGIGGERSGLWKEMLRAVRVVRPRVVLVENSSAILARGMGDVLADLSSLGMDAKWCCLSAAALGAPHIRDRAWILGYAHGDGEPALPQHDEASGMQANDSDTEPRLEPLVRAMGRTGRKHEPIPGNRVWQAEDSPVGMGVADGVPHRMDRLRALGNAQVPIVAATAYRILSGEYAS